MILLKLIGNFAAPVNLVRLVVDFQHVSTDALAAKGSFAHGFLERLVIAAGTEFKSSAHGFDRKHVAMIANPDVPHSDSFAKYAVAFFKISRSISAAFSCFRSRLISA